MPSAEFERLVDLLDQNPSEPCVVREEFLNNLGISAEDLATASRRKRIRVPEFHSLPERNMTLRDFVYSFTAREEA